MSALLVLALSLAAEPAWKEVSNEGGVRVEARPVAGSSFAELKVTTTTTASADRLCEEVFGSGRFDPEEPDLVSRQVISESEHERVTYDRISPALVSNRDYAVRAKWEKLEDGRCRMTFEAANGVAPPRPSGFVRITKLHGYWMFTPKGDGTTTVEYVIFTDPAGSIPALFAEGPRRGSAVRWVKYIVARALKPKP